MTAEITHLAPANPTGRSQVLRIQTLKGDLGLLVKVSTLDGRPVGEMTVKS